MDSSIGPVGERAWFRTVSAWGVEGVTDDVAQLENGFHVLVMTFEGRLTAVRMKNVRFHESEPWSGAGDLPGSLEPSCADQTSRGWTSSLQREAYEDVVRRIREDIAAGNVYQVNACRVLTREVAAVDMDGLFRDVLGHNPAPYACRIDIAGHLDVVSASPELFLSRDGSRVVSAPIKGTAAQADGMLDKDVAENIMITDLVRNDLQQVCEPGSVVVDPLLETQAHPGLVHLVSTVRGTLRREQTWAHVLGACFPPGSVSGAPKSSALRIIQETEPTPRGPYCGAIGWVDADSGRAELAVGIRTFWRGRGRNENLSSPIMSSTLSFGTGAGITWGSDPPGEWEETQLKARRLVALAQRHVPREKT